MKASRSNTKFSIILFIVCLFPTIQIYAEDQLNSTQNISTWNKFKASINNSAQFLKKNADYIAAAVIPTLAVLSLPRVTLEERHERARNLINSYKGSNFFWRLYATNILDKAYRVEKFNDEQLKKFITIERWLGALGLGVAGFVFYSLYKKSQYCLKNLDVDLEGKVTIAGEPIIIFERLGDSNTQSS